MSQFESAKIDFLRQLALDNFVFESTLEFIEMHFNFTLAPLITVVYSIP